MNNKIIGLLIVALLTSCDDKLSKLELSPLFSDGMVLQRNMEINIWGKSSQNSAIIITTEWGQKLKLKSDNIGNWSGELLTPEAGGPYFIKISSSNDNIIMKDILIGEIWLASGQSNICLLYTSPSPRDFQVSRMPSSA